MNTFGVERKINSKHTTPSQTVHSVHSYKKNDYLEKKNEGITKPDCL